jgi:hypothetical protein
MISLLTLLAKGLDVPLIMQNLTSNTNAGNRYEGNKWAQIGKVKEKHFTVLVELIGIEPKTS